MSRGQWIASVLAGAAIFLSGLWYFTQLLEWREHGHNYMLLVGNIVVTVLLWCVLILCVIRAWRSIKKTQALESKHQAEVAALKEAHKRQVDGIATTHRNEEYKSATTRDEALAEARKLREENEIFRGELAAKDSEFSIRLSEKNAEIEALQRREREANTHLSRAQKVTEHHKTERDEAIKELEGVKSQLLRPSESVWKGLLDVPPPGPRLLSYKGIEGEGWFGNISRSRVPHPTCFWLGGRGNPVRI